MKEPTEGMRTPFSGEFSSLNSDEPPPPHADRRFGYMHQLDAVAAAGNAVIKAKTETYADSWKARGGRGAWYTLVRPMDRLQNMVENQHQGDVFAAIEAGALGGDGTTLDALRDLRNYLNLVEAEMVARGVVKLPA